MTVFTPTFSSLCKSDECENMKTSPACRLITERQEVRCT